MSLQTPGFRRRLSRRRRPDEDRLRLLPIGWALTLCFAAAVLGLAGLSWVALAILHHPKLPATSSISLHDLISVLQLVFASVAGAGALVALVMAYRRQRVAEVATAHDRTRVLNERFTAIAAQLGDDNPAVRLAGIHAMAGLADDWEENRQTCVDVLCAYLRLPDDLDPGIDAPAADRLTLLANQEVRHTAVRVISAHLRSYAGTSWQGLDLDFAGVRFDGGDFRGVVFSGGTVNFGGARFAGEVIDFRGAVFSGGTVNFARAQFSADLVDISGAEFSRGDVDFSGAEFSAKTVYFNGARFWGAGVNFDFAQFSAGEVDFTVAEFHRGAVSFGDARFAGGNVRFLGTQFSGAAVRFRAARFCGGTVSFASAQFSGGTVTFGGEWATGAWFSAGEVSFRNAKFCGGTVLFEGARFSGSIVSFQEATVSAGEVSFNGAKFLRNTVKFEEAHFPSDAVSFEGAEFSDSMEDVPEDSEWFDPRLIPDEPHFNIVITDDRDDDQLPRRGGWWHATLPRAAARTSRRKGSAQAAQAGVEKPDNAQPEAD